VSETASTGDCAWQAHRTVIQIGVDASDVDEARPGADVGEVRKPEPVWGRSAGRDNTPQIGSTPCASRSSFEWAVELRLGKISVRLAQDLVGLP
jgi:hypothetical protein